MEKNRDPARPTATMASPAADSACTLASRVKGGVTNPVTGARRGVWSGRQPSGVVTRPSYGGIAGGLPRELAPRHLVLVAQAADGDDARRVGGIVLHLGTQPLDVDVQGLGIPHVVGAPHA